MDKGQRGELFAFERPGGAARLPGSSPLRYPTELNRNAGARSRSSAQPHASPCWERRRSASLRDRTGEERDAAEDGKLGKFGMSDEDS